MSFIKDLYKDEIRDGFLVTVDRKRLWNVQIELIVEFQRICKKYDLKYFAHAGTMLGAARHKGFIPWDDDVDLAMLRPDYEKFKQVAPKELKEPYYFDAWYNNDFPTVDPYACGWPVLCPFIKIRDERTTMIEAPRRRDTHQGIWIDVFPFEPVPPFNNQQDLLVYLVKSEISCMIMNPDMVRAEMAKGRQFVLSRDSIESFLKMSFREKTLNFENFCAVNFRETEFVLSTAEMFNKVKKRCETKWFESIIELPFENITIAAPKNYDKFLTASYGDWHKMIRGASSHNVKDISANISYKDYFDLTFDDEVLPHLRGGGN